MTRYLRINPKDITPGGPLAFARKLVDRKSKPGDGSASKHAQLQADAEQYCHIHGVAFIRLPDDLLKFIYGTSIEGVLYHHAKGLYGWLKGIRGSISTYLLGCPDLICFQKDGDYNRCACFEFKTGGAKPRKGQIKFAEKVNVKVIRNYPDFKEALDEWMDKEAHRD